MLQRELEKFAATLSDTYYPPQVVFETTAYCNLKCSMCSHKFMKRKKGEMPFSLFSKVIDEIATYDTEGTDIWFSVHGEALLRGPELGDFIRYAKKAKKRTFLNTNGMLLNSTNLEWLLDSGIDGIIIGLDGFSENSYNKIRNGGNYETVKNNTLALLKRLKEENRLTPTVEVQFVVMPENAHELEDFKKFWLPQGANLKIRNKLSWGGMVSTPYLESSGVERIPCVWLIRNLHVLWNGIVPLCGGDLEGDHPAGDVNKESLLSIWHGVQRDRRLMHLNRQFEKLSEPCKSCWDWQVADSLKLKAEQESLT